LDCKYTSYLGNEEWELRTYYVHHWETVRSTREEALGEWEEEEA
jgi:hypothetical protein